MARDVNSMRPRPLAAPAMTRHQARFLCQLLLAGDVALSALAFALAFELRRWLPTTDAGAGLGSLVASESYGPLLLGMLPLWALAFGVTNSNDVRQSLGVAAQRHLRAVGLGLLLLIGAGFLLHLQFISRGFVVLLAGSQLLLLWAMRALVLQVVRHREVDHRMLVVGCDDAAVRFAEALRRHAWSQRLVGFVAVPEAPRSAAATPVVAEVEALAELLDREPIDEVVFTVTERGGPHVRAAIDACQIRGVDVLMAMPAGLPCHGRIELAELAGAGVPMLSISHTPAGPSSFVGKRVLDVLGASLLLAITAPVVLLAALALWLESPGPVLTRRVRAGRNGRRFTMLGLRCVTAADEAALAHRDPHAPAPGDPSRAASPPLTRVGALLHATGIDALPQLLNVLFGHMSLVGPRAPRLTEVACYEPWQRRRLSVRPGITGLRQLRARRRGAAAAGEPSMSLDLRYIDTWSLGLDLAILARSLPTMVHRPGAS
jgi:lipopolysaccharide/colanic/teichoic acid biosynthesis glycosyltransferase